MHTSAIKRIASIRRAFLGIIAIAVQLALRIGIAALDRRIEAGAIGHIANVTGAHVTVVAVIVDCALGRQVAIGQRLIQASAGVDIANFKRTSVLVIAVRIDLASAAAALHDLVVANAVLRLTRVSRARIAVAAVGCLTNAFASRACVASRTRRAVRASPSIERRHHALAICALISRAHVVVIAGRVGLAVGVATWNGRELASAGLAAAGSAAALVAASIVGAGVVVVAHDRCARAGAVDAQVGGGASDIVVAHRIARCRCIEALATGDVATVQRANVVVVAAHRSTSNALAVGTSIGRRADQAVAASNACQQRIQALAGGAGIAGAGIGVIAIGDFGANLAAIGNRR